jgi:hypothetical protein
MIRIGAVTTLFQGTLSKDSNRSRAKLRAFASPVLALLLLFLGCSNPGSAQVHENNVETDRDKSASVMIEEYQDSIRDFLRNIPPSIFDSIEFGAIEERWRGAHSKAKFTLNRAQREERTDVEVDMQTGRVVDYMWPWPEPESKTVPISQAIPMNSAFEAATPVLEYYGLSEDIADYTVAAPDADDPDRGLLLAEWAFSCAFEYEGLPCRHTGIWIDVSAFSGRVRSVKYLPVVEPKPLTNKISKEAAVEIARQYLPQCGHLNSENIWVSEAAENEVSEVIAFPNGNFDEIRESDDIQPWNSYYCWEVPFEWEPQCELLEGDRRQAVLWITMDSGKPIGGGG